jgi:hypothetical protein
MFGRSCEFVSYTGLGLLGFDGYATMSTLVVDFMLVLSMIKCSAM